MVIRGALSGAIDNSPALYYLLVTTLILELSHYIYNFNQHL